MKCGGCGVHTNRLKNGLCADCDYKRKASEQLMQPLNMAAYANKVLGDMAWTMGANKKAAR
jgi:hypothetical protein